MLSEELAVVSLHPYPGLHVWTLTLFPLTHCVDMLVHCKLYIFFLFLTQLISLVIRNVWNSAVWPMLMRFSLCHSQIPLPGRGCHSSATSETSVDAHSSGSWRTPAETWCTSSRSSITMVIPAPATSDFNGSFPKTAPLPAAASETHFNCSTTSFRRSKTTRVFAKRRKKTIVANMLICVHVRHVWRMV